MRRAFTLSICLAGFSLLLGGEGQADATSSKKMVLIPAGKYLPFYPPKRPAGTAPTPTPGALPQPVDVTAFQLDRYPVTNREYAAFVKSHPEWRKSQVKAIFNDGHYLQNWKSDSQIGNSSEWSSPVVHVSWFAAEAYCEAQGKTLPTVDQWEYAASDQGRDRDKTNQRILEWYSNPNPKKLAPVRSASRNRFGVHGLHGLVWEWTLDFNRGIQTEEARENGTQDNNLFCGNGSQGAIDPTDYASFMRYGFRNSLKANYAVGNLGFRCAQEDSQNE